VARALVDDWAIDSPVNDWVRTGDHSGIPSAEIRRQLDRLAASFADIEAATEARVRAELAGKAASILREISQDMDDAASLIEREWSARATSTSPPETAGEKEGSNG
jgi:hypothetical protein